jgi:hypothetical protein
VAELIGAARIRLERRLDDAFRRRLTAGLKLRPI